MTDGVVVVNAGSSSLKCSLYAIAGADLALQWKGHVDGLGTPNAHFEAKDAAGRVIGEHRWPAREAPTHDDAVHHVLGFLREAGGPAARAVGHRVVHGGERYAEPVLVDAGVLAVLDTLVPLAPLHQPHNLAPIRAIAAELPDLPQVACFDTAFHRTHPPLAQAFALPPSITERGVRRYGFHGLSYEYVAHALPAVDARAARGRVIVAHLGNGASMCAIHDGRSVASTMGFTALDGLVMGTRTGALDPGVLLYLMDELGMDARAIERLLYRESGLLGVSGVSSDMRTLLASAEPRAKFAVDLFCYRAGRELGSLAAALGGLDALVFTGGIGEHAAPVRAQVVDGAAWLGLELDPDANVRHATRITTPDSDVPAYVVPTNEELMIARHVRAVTGC
ncbi:MAG TPA: acetate/propionate family kinase [Casimicrobiaceae bacterium]|nr:acetate/propionate family kinase [Casimicrobiaceae bacterium]